MDFCIKRKFKTVLKLKQTFQFKQFRKKCFYFYKNIHGKNQPISILTEVEI